MKFKEFQTKFVEKIKIHILRSPSDCVIVIAFTLRQWFHERASLLRHTTLHVLLFCTHLCQKTADEAFEVRRLFQTLKSHCLFVHFETMPYLLRLCLKQFAKDASKWWNGDSAVPTFAWRDSEWLQEAFTGLGNFNSLWVPAKHGSASQHST